MGFRPPPGGGRRFAKLAETFLAEAGVLLLVFPMLDEYVQYGARAMTPRLVVGSMAFAAFFFTIAGIIAVYAKE